ncbi:MAG: hypothetical protein RSE39_06535 [Oscillospiraceae bacterium]
MKQNVAGNSTTINIEKSISSAQAVASKAPVENVADTEIKKPLADNKTRVFDASKVIEKAVSPKAEVETKQTSVEDSHDLDPGESFFSSVEKKDIKFIDFKKSASDNSDTSEEHIMKLASEYVPGEPVQNKQSLPDIHPIFDENIVHNITRKKVEKPTSSMESDKYRTRFINRPVQNLEKTADYEKLHLNEPQPRVERPGFIVKKKDFSNTADLEPIPTIISVDDELENVASEKTRVAKVVSNNSPAPEPEDEIAGQIKLSGFSEPEKIEKIDEEVAEDSLKKSRKEKLKSFRISTDFESMPLDKIGETDDQTDENAVPSSPSYTLFSNDYIDEEYNSTRDKCSILQKLSRKAKLSLVFACLETLLFIASVVISTLIFNAKGDVVAVGGNITICMLINILILLVSCLFSMRTFTAGISGIFKLKPNAGTATTIVFLLCLIQCIVLIFTADGSLIESVIYAPVACFAFTLSAFSHFFVLKRALGNFEFCTGGTSLYSTQEVAEELDEFEIGRGLLLGEPDVRYSSRINFPEKFMESSFLYNPEDKISSKLIPCVLIAALLVSAISGFITKSAFDGFSAFVAVCCIGFPVFSMLSSNLPMWLTNKKLNSHGSAILGHKAALDCAGTNAIVVDSSDLFKKGSCSIDGIKTFNSMRIDEAILDAAALVIESGGPLVDIFDGVILNRREILPPVESLAYEDRLGLSAWIHGNRILLGSRDLLVNHNVLAPEKDVEMKYIQKGKKVMYLSVAGKIAAMFVISYCANEAISRALRSIDESGVTILVRTTDCNITEELLCQSFDLPLSAIKIISPISGDIFNKYRLNTIEKSQSGIFHNGPEASFLNALVQALRLNKLVSINSIVQIIYSSVSIAIFSLLSFLSALSSIGAGQIIAFQVLWTIIACLIPVFKKS